MLEAVKTTQAEVYDLKNEAQTKVGRAINQTLEMQNVDGEDEDKMGHGEDASSKGEESQDGFKMMTRANRS